ncbi:MAG: L,D-transpeptidase family protein, partial [Paracoccaceae bacterium]|nr:L,D-transpeptidase family protein [Paracoccaceae bacterium]
MTLTKTHPALFRMAFSQALFVITGLFFLISAGLAPARAQIAPFIQAIAEAAAKDDVIAGFYRDRGYRSFWTGTGDADRRAAFLSVLARAGDHGLPVQRYDAPVLIAAFHATRTEGDRGRLEVRMTRALLDYARDIQTGALVPARIDPGIVREVAVRDRRGNLDGFNAAPAAFLAALPPRSPDYTLLLRAKLRLEQKIAQGGWGPTVGAASLKPGQSGDPVIALRDRLIAMGYLRRNSSRDYDGAIQQAVQDFQVNHGLDADGIADESTLAEINIGPQARLQSIVVALERQRWLNIDRGRRHIWVNLADFSAKIIDDGKVTFSTRSVIGKNDPDRRSPEFSDVMEYMVINPTWNVPRSITVKEYLPLMQRNPNAAGHLKLIDSKGRVVNRGAVDFSQYTARNFPFAMRQPPSDGNALGLVKFMFPNPWNIYLHDTPS